MVKKCRTKEVENAKLQIHGVENSGITVSISLSSSQTGRAREPQRDRGALVL